MSPVGDLTEDRPSEPSIPSPPFRWQTRILLPVAFLFASGALLVGALWSTLFPPRVVSVVPVIVKELGESIGKATVTASGWLEPDPFPIYVSALASGVVEELTALEGHEILAGETIARLVSADAEIGLRRAEADLFERESDPTSTRPEKAFVARAASDMIEIVGFASWLGWGALVAIFALVANAIILAVHDRVKEHAILQTLGYKPRHVTFLILMEAMLLGVGGGLFGAVMAFLVIQRGFALTMEGLNLEVSGDLDLLVIGFALSIGLGLLAGVFPALRAARREIAEGFRAV